MSLTPKTAGILTTSALAAGTLTLSPKSASPFTTGLAPSRTLAPSTTLAPSSGSTALRPFHVNTL